MMCIESLLSVVRNCYNNLIFARRIHGEGLPSGHCSSSRAFSSSNGVFIAPAELHKSHLSPSQTSNNMAPRPEDAKRIEEAQKVAKKNPSEAEATYRDILAKGPGTGEAGARDYENALLGLGELYRDSKRADELSELVKTSRSTVSSFAKAKTSKLGEPSSTRLLAHL